MDEVGAATRDEDVDEACCAQQLRGLGVGLVVAHVLDGIRRKPRPGNGGAAELGYGLARGGRRGASLEDAGVARAQAEGERVGRDVRAGLEDDGHRAERHRDLLDGEAVVEDVPGEDAAERVGLAGDLVHGVGDGCDALGGEGQTVLEGKAHAVPAGSLEVLPVGGHDFGFAVTQRLGAEPDGLRARLGGGRGNHRRRLVREPCLAQCLSHVGLSPLLQDEKLVPVDCGHGGRLAQEARDDLKLEPADAQHIV